MITTLLAYRVEITLGLLILAASLALGSLVLRYLSRERHRVLIGWKFRQRPEDPDMDLVLLTTTEEQAIVSQKKNTPLSEPLEFPIRVSPYIRNQLLMQLHKFNIDASHAAEHNEAQKQGDPGQ